MKQLNYMRIIKKTESPDIRFLFISGFFLHPSFLQYNIKAELIIVLLSKIGYETYLKQCCKSCTLLTHDSVPRQNILACNFHLQSLITKILFFVVRISNTALCFKWMNI